MSEHRASCSCGQLTATRDGEPVRISVCHCLACQQRTGSVFGAQARWPKENVILAGHSHEYARTGDSGGRAVFHFCPECGSTVYYRIDDQLDTIAVPVDAFADPAFPAPRVPVYEERKHA
ncbi:MAG TPA: GFA family protein [Rhizomicrobium sp.]